MRKILLYIRSWLFDAIFYIFTALYLSIFLPLSLLLPRNFTMFLFDIWANCVMWLLKIIVGLSYKIENFEIIEKMQGPCIIACKHQSAWETIIFATLLKDFVIILKKQLLWLPVFGIYLRKINSIGIDRSKGLQAIKDIIKKGKIAIKNGYSILIFPEGTRQIIGTKPTYQTGVGALYKNLNVPVVPVALNSGFYWGRRGLYKTAGVITLKFLSPIEAGLDRQEFLKKLETAIEDGCKSI
jgi:1-acyl-sn-glycerol-3-phosphate acyltransferase